MYFSLTLTTPSTISSDASPCSAYAQGVCVYQTQITTSMDGGDMKKLKSKLIFETEGQQAGVLFIEKLAVWQ